MNSVVARSVGEAMTRGLVSVRAKATLYSAAQLMDAHHVHGLVVIDDDLAPVGVLSQTDLLRARTIEDFWMEIRWSPVLNLMTAPAITIGLDASLDEATALMKERHVHRLVVVGPDGATPVGVLSVSDLVHVMAGPEAIQ